MATKSILKTVHIDNHDVAIAFANALEHAKAEAEKEKSFSVFYSEASREEIQKMFIE